MSTDPILAALRDQRRLHASFVAACDMDDDTCTAAAAAYNAAFDALLKTRPRTRAGAAELIRYCMAEDSRFPTKADGGDAVTLLRTLAKALPALA